MKYDDAGWHAEGAVALGSPEELGATHIALFLRWCFTKGWVGEVHLEDEPEQTRGVIAGTYRATDFLLEYCDGKLTNEDFDEAGNVFAMQYYGDRGLYLDDYSTHFKGLMYLAPEEEHDFEQFSSILEARFRSGELTRPPKPWWRFW